MEIYEVPTLTALEIKESCQGRSNHRAERDALHKFAESSDKVRLEHFASIVARSGCRSELRGSDGPSNEISKMIEIEPVMGADLLTIDLKISIRYPTAKTADGKSHIKSIEAKFSTTDGFYTLLGSWKPTGKPKYETTNLEHLIFIRAIMQKGND